MGAMKMFVMLLVLTARPAAPTRDRTKRIQSKQVMKGGYTVDEVNWGTVCFDGTGNGFGEFAVPSEFQASTVILEHVSSTLECWPGSPHTNWGCDNGDPNFHSAEFIGAILVNAADEIILPNADTANIATHLGSPYVQWYTYQASDSSNKGFNGDRTMGNSSTLNWTQQITIPAGQYRLAYTEDWFDYSDNDNGGRACAVVKAYGQATAGGGGTPATATGDPHLRNMLGERFDLMRPGTSVLVHVPRGTPIEDALLVVKADVRRVGEQCSDMYFQDINVTGTWADKAQPGGFHFDARGARHEKPQWVHLGPVELKVGHGHTDEGILYLNVFVKNLGRAGVPVGGLLGEDDHTEAAAPADGCRKLLSLNSGPHGLAAHRQGSIAVGS